MPDAFMTHDACAAAAIVVDAMADTRDLHACDEHLSIVDVTFIREEYCIYVTVSVRLVSLSPRGGRRGPVGRREH